MRLILSLFLCVIVALSANGFLSAKRQLVYQNIGKLGAIKEANMIRKSSTLFASTEPEDLDETTKKYGLEAGLYKAVTAKSEDGQTIKPQDLLKKYGAAYLATSITLAIISYALCYLLVSTGVDVAALLEKVGLQSTTAAANTGTAAIAYAVHKAASPIRFPPTVVLTPIVAGWLGKKLVVDEEKK